MSYDRQDYALLEEVRSSPWGSVLAAAASVSDTELVVVNGSEFDAVEGGILDLNGARLAYTTVIDGDLPDDPDTIVLADPLAVAADAEDTVSVVIGGQIAEDVDAYVTMGEGDQIIVPLTVDQRSQWPLGVYDPPVPVVVSDDMRRLEDAPGRTSPSRVKFQNADTVTAEDAGEVVLTLTYLPMPGSLLVRQNGLLLELAEYGRDGVVVTIPEATLKRAGDVFTAYYAHDNIATDPEALPDPDDSDYIGAVMSDGPVLYAMLDGNADDSSGNDHHGTVGGTVETGREALAPGLPGTSIDFTDGGYVEFAPGAAWQRPTPFTIEGWFQLDALNPTVPAILAGCDDLGAADVDRIWNLLVPSEGSANSVEGAVFSGSTPTLAADTVEIVVSATYYVAMDFDGSDIRLFLNNVLVDSASTPGAMNTATTWPLVLGSTADGEFGHYGVTMGRLQHWALYDKVLADDRRAAHYSIGRAL